MRDSLAQPAMLRPPLTFVRCGNLTGFEKFASGLSRMERPAGTDVSPGRVGRVTPLKVNCRESMLPIMEHGGRISRSRDFVMKAFTMCSARGPMML